MTYRNIVRFVLLLFHCLDFIWISSFVVSTMNLFFVRFDTFKRDFSFVTDRYDRPELISITLPGIYRKLLPAIVTADTNGLQYFLIRFLSASIQYGELNECQSTFRKIQSILLLGCTISVDIRTFVQLIASFFSLSISNLSCQLKAWNWPKPIYWIYWTDFQIEHKNHCSPTRWILSTAKAYLHSVSNTILYSFFGLIRIHTQLMQVEFTNKNA